MTEKLVFQLLLIPSCLGGLWFAWRFGESEAGFASLVLSWAMGTILSLLPVAVMLFVCVFLWYGVAGLRELLRRGD
ncbi:hypothetical protein [Cupriavidus metallidurans]|uniref:Uncharacterized protein n=1 Tax=Cupriavidus metallidurans TaxID=119219 RepID=A0A482IQH5_9BURK|nr:hypothetical protein [Cupriavidus metallidurans]QBP09853.1 hypothetical protein DDF84_008810 [Cupriavidus metallidurans]